MTTETYRDESEYQMTTEAPNPNQAPREWDATAYHQVSNPQFVWGMKVLDTITLNGDETVIDAGCGTGRLTAELLERLPNGHVIALDQSENMLQTAREMLVPRFGDRVSFIQADLLKLNMHERADGIFSTATFHWIPDHALLFQNLWHALKPGGWLVAQCGGEHNIARIMTRADALMAQEPYSAFQEKLAAHRVYASTAETHQRLHDAGFIGITTTLEETPTPFANAADYSAYVAPVILRVHLDALPDQALRDRFVATITEAAAHDDPPFVLDYFRLNMRAHRPIAML